MKNLSAPILGTALACLLLNSAAHAVLVVDSPINIGGPNILSGTAPIVTNGDTVSYTVVSADATNGEIFFQFEANETSQSAISVGLDFSQDSVSFHTYGPLSLIPLPQNQTAFEWRISGITLADVGSEISVAISISGQTDGPERALFSQASLVAVPEPSALLFGTLVCSVLGIVKFKSARK